MDTSHKITLLLPLNWPSFIMRGHPATPYDAALARSISFYQFRTFTCVINAQLPFQSKMALCPKIH